ncbi:hypothetical protein [Actinokineospora sp.]|uniref:hypothetical protein n=1 Tax=Actinokineospora sp. TaxID=1872133 RepID=UPI004037D810
MTRTYNPILEITELRRIRVAAPIRPPRFGTALVLDAADGAVLVRHGERVPDARTGNYRRCLLIDTASYGLQFDARLPSSDSSFTFASQVNFTCQVVDPVTIALNNVTNMTESLRPSMTKVLREVSQRFDILDVANAEAALNDALDRVGPAVAVRLGGFSVEVASGDTSEIHRLRGEVRLDEIRRSAMRPVVQGGRDEMVAQIMALNNGDPSTVLGHEAAVAALEKDQLLEALKILSNTGEKTEAFDTERKRDQIYEQLLGGKGGVLSAPTRRGPLRPRLTAGRGTPESVVVEQVEPVDGRPGQGEPVRGPRPSTSDGSAAPEEKRRPSRLRGTARRDSD